MDFEGSETIEIRYYTDKWGPYKFDLSDNIPSGATISAVTARAFVGKVKPEDADNDFEDQTEIPTLFDGDPSYGGDYVNVYFQWPGAAYRGKVTLVFEVTFNPDTGKYPFFFNGLKIV